MSIDSNNYLFSTQDFSFDAFLKHRKESASKNEDSTELSHLQDKSQKNSNSQNEQSELSSDSKSSAKDKNAFADTKDTYIFSAASYFQGKKDAENNKVEEDAISPDVPTNILPSEENVLESEKIVSLTEKVLVMDEIKSAKNEEIPSSIPVKLDAVIDEYEAMSDVKQESSASFALAPPIHFIV